MEASLAAPLHLRAEPLEPASEALSRDAVVAVVAFDGGADAGVEGVGLTELERAFHGVEGGRSRTQSVHVTAGEKKP